MFVTSGTDQTGPVTVRTVFDRRGALDRDLLQAVELHRPDIVHLQHTPDILGVDGRVIRLLTETDDAAEPQPGDVTMVHSLAEAAALLNGLASPASPLSRRR